MTTDLYGDPLPEGAAARLGCSRLMHAHRVDDLCFSPNGRLVASCGADIRVWETTDGKLRHRLDGHRHRVRRIAWSPDGGALASVADDGTLQLWDAATGERRAKVSLDRQEGRAVGFGGDDLVVVGAYTNVLVFTRRGKLLGQLEQCEGWVTDLVCHPREPRVYVATERDLWAFALPTKRLLSWSKPPAKDHRRLSEEGGGALCISADGRRLISSPYGKLHIWELPDGQDRHDEQGGPAERLEREIAFDGQATQIRVSPDGERLLTGGREGAQLWSMTGQPLGTFAENHYGVAAVDFSPTGDQLATGAQGGDVRLWQVGGADRADGAADTLATVERLVFPRHRHHIETMSFSPDGARLVTVGGSKVIRLWDARSGAQLYEIDPGDVGGSLVVHSPTGEFFAASRGDGVVVLYDPETGAETERLAAPTRSGWFRSLAVSPDGQHVVACRGDQELHCWRRGSEEPRWTKPVGGSPLSYLDVSPDGRHLAASDGRSIQTWSFPEGTPGACFGDAVGRTAFVDDRTLLGFGTDRFVRTWDVVTGAELTRAWYAGSDGVVSPTGEMVALAQDGVTTFHAVPGLELLGQLRRDDESPGATFSPDGKRFASVEAARTVVVWDIPEVSRAARGPAPVYPGAAALAGYRLTLDTRPPEDFVGVRIGDGCTHRASPEPDDYDFLGIAIHLPTKGRVLGADEAERLHRDVFDPPASPLIPMAGYIARRGDADIAEVYVVAVDDETGERMRGRLVLDRPTSAQLAPMPDFDDDEPALEADLGVEDYTSGSWFTLNLSELVAIPDAPAVYRVHLEHAVVETLRSNEVRVEVV